MTSLKRGRPLKSQAREIIFNVHRYMEKEAQKAKNQVLSKDYFQQIFKRTSEATGISTKTISKILKEQESTEGASTSAGPSFSTPKKGRMKKAHRLELDDFDYQQIRRKIHDFHLVEKQVVTVNSLLNNLKTEINFSGSRETLRRIIRELGFKFRRVETNRKLLAEKDEVRLLRIKYLRDVKKTEKKAETLCTQTNHMCTRHIQKNVPGPIKVVRG